MLERITKYVRGSTILASEQYSIVRASLLTEDSFMAHPETLLPMPNIDDPVQRFVSVVKFYLSGWHIKPPYVPHPVPLSLYLKVLI
jgi:hypothetical protein